MSQEGKKCNGPQCDRGVRKKVQFQLVSKLKLNKLEGR